ITYRGAAVEGAYVKDYEVYVSQDGNNWGNPVARGTFEKNSNVQNVLFFSPARARYIRLVPISSHDGGDFAAVSEIDVIPAQ
ncbi:MAG: discoidin domain-containing protein, partial [Akkermansia sp.]|nr:discoidin domain-containing protein [Akkermansia sp.]